MRIFADDDSRASADRLDQLWDRLIQSGEHLPPELSGDDAASAALAAYLHQIAPNLSGPARDRLRARVFAPSKEGATPMNLGTTTTLDRGGALIAPLPPQPRPLSGGKRRGILHHPLSRIAATLLLVITLAVSWLAIRNGDQPPPRPTVPQYAATSPESDDASADGQPVLTDSTPAADNATVIIHPFNLEPITWEIPEDVGEIRLSLFEITIEPGVTWIIPFSGATQFQIQSGAVAISFDPASSPDLISGPGGSVSYAGDGEIIIANTGPEPATVIQGAFSVAVPYGPDLTLPDGVTVRVLAARSTTAGPGPVSIHILIEQIQGAGGTTTHYLPAGFRLVTLIEGTTSLARMGGTIDLYSEDGPPVIPNPLTPIGTAITLHPGNVFFAHPGSGFSLAPQTSDAAWLLVLAVYPVPTENLPVASPVASPVIEPIVIEGSLIEVTPADCTIEPRPIEEFAAILADPYAEGTPQASLRDQAGPGTPADQRILNGIVDTVKQIVACNSPASLEMYSLYSANLLRFHAALGNITIDEIAGLESFDPSQSRAPVSGYISVEEVVVFPDGRVGAMVNANGEMAYITFVFENGRWLIDFWDDQFEGAG